MMFVLINSNTTGLTSGAGTAKTFPGYMGSSPGFSGVRVAQYLVFWVMF